MSRLRIFCAVLCVAIGFSQFSLDPVLGAIPACADVHVVWARGSDVDIGTTPRSTDSSRGIWRGASAAASQ
jgi:hypothetical protein